MLTGTYRFPPMESVVYGRPFAEALREQVEQSGANSVFLLASGTLNRDTDMVGQVRQALGNRLAGIFARIGAHTPRVDVVAAANAARDAGADLLVTLGGGSVTDAAKMVAFCLGNDVTDPAQLDEHRNRVERRRQDRAPAIEAALGAHDRDPDDPVGRRIHRVGRLHRHGAQRQGELRPSADDAEIGRARSARDGAHAGMAVSVDRHPRRRSRGRGHLLAAMPADLGRRIVSRAAAARPRAARASRPTRSTSRRGSRRSSAPGCR